MTSTDPASTAISATGRRVRVVLDLRPSAEALAVSCRLDVQDGWYVYAPNATDGLPVTLGPVAGGPAPSANLLTDFPPTPDGHLSGSVVLRGSAPRSLGATAFELRVQACNGRTCEAPERLRLGPLTAPQGGTA